MIKGGLDELNLVLAGIIVNEVGQNFCINQHLAVFNAHTPLKLKAVTKNQNWLSPNFN